MVNITFTGTERSGTEHDTLEVFATVDNEICVEMCCDGNYQSLHLDRDTAIKLVKELRKEIGELIK